MKRKIFGLDPEEAYERVMKRLEQREAEGRSSTPPPSGTTLEDRTTFWTIGNVPYRKGICRVDLLKTLLDNGKPHTQEEWSSYSQQAQPNNQFSVADFPLYHSLFATLFRSKDSPNKQEIEAIRTFLKDKFEKHWLLTLTRVRYEPSGVDTVIHNHGMPDRYEIQEHMAGPHEWVKDAAQKAPYQALLGTEDTQEIQAVYRWITGKDAYLWRLNKKPEQSPDERIAWFYTGAGRAGLDCIRLPSDSDPALGVRVCAAGAPKK